ncbi:glycosyltransferase family 8 protein [Sporormia fimetaria CBS 119925]|uniref:Glycosyltransferase family 8 protein n=1 Tax=Sporormia fimetaria CBS 119925 TaxID=1340428 RepID=A0A6A6VP56_9PLEO|nr:glycosyltransferase family 8 protein [Sporormia fimetaria CBS 119925]
MGRLLLTSGQVSVLLSSCIIFVFTVVLFLSGYVVQQRSVSSLQAAIRPIKPKPLPIANPIEPPTLNAKWARAVGDRPLVDESVEQLIAGETLDWSRLGYVQLARDHSEVCSAVMLLADLHKMKSPAKKLLLFPRVWVKKGDTNENDPEMATTWRLLRTAARRYGATLIPVETIVDGADDTLPSSYSLASLYSLTSYERLMYIQGPGVLFDASALDSLLAFSKSEPLTAYPANPGRDAISTSLFLAHPSTAIYRKLKEARAGQAQTDLKLFRTSFEAPGSLFSEWSLSMGNVIYESPYLRDAADDFNATEFEQKTTFVRLSDPELPGPEYDVPFQHRVELWPENEEARGLWERLYDSFQQRRMEVCGLDLEYWQRPALSAASTREDGAVDV